MKYCIFSGTFNPVHNAHLCLANKVLKEYNFGKIIFIPAYMQPHKDKESCIKSAEHRLAMLELALNEYPQFEINTIEYDRKGLSYTYDTIVELYKKLSDIEGKINFIIGTDSLIKIKTWHEAEKLIELVNFIVLIRNKEELQKCEKISNITYSTLNTNIVDISSTAIREHVKNNSDISKLVPISVMEYIKENSLYRD